MQKLAKNLQLGALINVAVQDYISAEFNISRDRVVDIEFKPMYGDFIVTIMSGNAHAELRLNLYSCDELGNIPTFQDYESPQVLGKIDLQHL